MWLKMNHLHCRREFVGVKSVERERETEREAMELKINNNSSRTPFGSVGSIPFSNIIPCTAHARFHAFSKCTDRQTGEEGLAGLRKPASRERNVEREREKIQSITHQLTLLIRWLDEKNFTHFPFDIGNLFFFKNHFDHTPSDKIKENFM